MQRDTSISEKETWVFFLSGLKFLMLFSLSFSFHNCNSNYSVPEFANIQYSRVKKKNNRELGQTQNPGKMNLSFSRNPSMDSMTDSIPLMSDLQLLPLRMLLSTLRSTDRFSEVYFST